MYAWRVLHRVVTGVNPAKHGICLNTVFDPLEKERRAYRSNAQDIRVPTLYQLARCLGRRQEGYRFSTGRVSPSRMGILSLASNSCNTDCARARPMARRKRKIRAERHAPIGRQAERIQIGLAAISGEPRRQIVKGKEVGSSPRRDPGLLSHPGTDKREEVVSSLLAPNQTNQSRNQRQQSQSHHNHSGDLKIAVR